MFHFVTSYKCGFVTTLIGSRTQKPQHIELRTMPYKGGKRKKTRTHVIESTENQAKIPKSFVFKTGKVPALVQELISDLRLVMAPYTAKKLKERKSNSLKDFVNIAGPLGVSHFLMVSSTTVGTNLKIARIPRGPTLSFKITEYSLSRQVKAIQRRPIEPSSSFQTPPLVVLNSFGTSEDHLKLMTVTFQNMFPAIDVQKILLSDCRRVVLFNYNKEKNQVEFRQYAIRAKPVGVTRSVKQILKAKVPNLRGLEDISEFVLGGGTGAMSDSEVDEEDTHVVLPDNYGGRGNQKAEQSALRLAEIGPRLSLKLIKVEKEVCDGDVLYHAFITKTPEEAARDKAKKQAAIALKKKRRDEQNANVSKKKQAEDEKRTAREESRDKKRRRELSTNPQVEDDIDDATYYEQEVGSKPDRFAIDDTNKNKKSVISINNKKNKFQHRAKS